MLARYSETELVQLTDDAGAGVVDEDRVNRALAGAASIADGYIASKYQLPIDPVPDFIVDAVCAIARFRLYRETPPEGVKDAHNMAIKSLKDVASGSLKIDSGTEEQVIRPGAVLIEGADRIFSRDKLKGF